MAGSPYTSAKYNYQNMPFEILFVMLIRASVFLFALGIHYVGM